MKRFQKIYYSTVVVVMVVMSLFYWRWWYSEPASISAIDTPAPASSRQHEPIQPLPPAPELDSSKVKLGQQLFHDPRLSHNGKASCASCHNLSQGGVDRLAKSLDIRGGSDEINTPTVFNAAYSLYLTWNGRLPSLAAQLDDVMNNPRHMGNGWASALNELKGDKGVSATFRQVYGATINRENLTDALVIYQRTLVTPDAPFDRFLRGDEEAVSEGARYGYRLFKEYGCIACHQGVNIGGHMLARFGIFKDYFADQKQHSNADLGLYSHTGNDQDRHVFRVPSLRNVALTPPYFHDGSADTLLDAVGTMAEFQLGRSIPLEDALAIVTFLESLTGEFSGKPL